MLAFDSEGRLRLENYSSQIDNLRSQLNALPSDDKKRFGIQQEIDQTLSDQTSFAFTQAQKRIEFYREAIAGLTEDLNKLKNADPATLRQLDDQFRGEKLQERIGQYTEINRLKYDLANSPYINSLEIERSYLEDLAVLRNQETEAIIAGNRSRLEIAQQGIYSQNRADASVLQVLAQQKGITEIVSDTKINLLTTAYSGLELVADKLTRKFGAFRDVIKDLISNLLKLALNKLFGGFLTGGQSGGGFSVGGSGQQGGSINLANLLSGFGGGGGQQGGGILSGLTGSFGSGGGFGGTPAFGGGSGLFGGLYGSGAAGTSNFGFNAPGAASGGLLSQASSQGSSLGGLFSSGSGGGGIGGLLSGLGSALPFLGATLGASVGGSSIGGNILGGIGGLLGAAVIPGLFGSAAGAGVLGGIGGIFGLSAAAFAPIAAVAAPLLIAGAYFLARDKARKRDERTRNQLMLDSLSALDKLIEGVNNDRIDGPQALEQADQIRKQYVEQATALKDKKTRGIALKDVSRLDIKISELKSAIAAQTGRRERLELLVPTFASGGPSAGYQQGAGHGTSDNLLTYFPAAGRSGYVSPTEYILDAQTTSAIGVNNLDVMRATKGRSYSAMRKRLTVPRMASGGTFVPEVNSDGSIGSGGNGGPMTLELAVQVGLSTEEFVRVISSAIVNNNGSRQNINAITKTIKNGGDSEFTRVIAEEVRKLLQ